MWVVHKTDSRCSDVIPHFSTQHQAYIYHPVLFWTLAADAEKDDETRMEIMFDRLMLTELRENVAKLDAKAYAELKAYNSPPQIVLHILRATLAIFYIDLADEGEFDDWTKVKSVRI